MKGNTLFIILTIKCTWIYEQALLRINNVEFDTDLIRIVKDVKDSKFHKVVYSKYIESPLISIPYYTKTKIDENILSDIIHMKILNLCRMLFYRVCNENLSIEFIRLILTTDYESCKDLPYNHFLTVMVAKFFRRIILICLIEDFILINYWNNLKEIYNPANGYFEIFSLIDFQYLQTINYLRKPFTYWGNQILYNDFINEKLNELHIYEVMALKKYISDTVSFLDPSFTHMINQFNIEKSLINYLFFYHGIREVLDDSFEIISTYYLYLNKFGSDKACVSIISANAFQRGEFRILKGLYYRCYRKMTFHNHHFHSIEHKQIILNEYFELDFFLSLLQFHCERCGNDLVVEIFETGSKLIISTKKV